MSKKVGLNESRTLKTTCTKPFQMGVTSSQFGLADAGRNSAGLTGSHREIHQHELWTVLWSQKWRASRHHVCRGRILWWLIPSLLERDCTWTLARLTSFDCFALKIGFAKVCLSPDSQQCVLEQPSCQTARPWDQGFVDCDHHEGP